MIGDYKIVALCISRIQENFSHDFVMTFSDVLKHAGYRLFVYNACSDLENNESKNSGQKYTFDLTKKSTSSPVEELGRRGPVRYLCAHVCVHGCTCMHTHTIPCCEK